jgi:hypothetical protein
MANSQKESSKLDKINTVLALVALIISIKSFFFSYYTYSKEQQERVLIMSNLQLSRNYKMKLSKVSDHIIVPVYWDVILSNNSDKNVSIVMINAYAKNLSGKDFWYSGLYKGLYLNYDERINLPINIGAGESKKFLLCLGLICDSTASNILTKKFFKPTSTFATTEVLTDFYSIIKILSLSREDFFGTRVIETSTNNFECIGVKPNKQPHTTVDFISSRNSYFTNNFVFNWCDR